MHLRRLELGALGPFAGTHTVDFDELGASGLFLLEGPTGAGKSTVIDAVVFALYGKVASEHASDDRLRSGYAADDVDTFVDLVFETRSGVYRVRRQPERLRAKRRGTGTTRQQASVRLWRLADADDPDGGELLSTRLDEAGAEIQRAVGLDRAQFVQTIVLPQGEFASFLRAKPEERRGLLQKVFGTDVYERVQDRLVAMRRESQSAVESARSAVSAAAAHFVGAASVTDDPGFAVGRARSAAAGDDGVGPDDRLATAAELRALGDAADPALGTAAAAHVTALSHEARQARGSDERAQRALVAARAALDEARTLADAVARRDALRAERAALVARDDEHVAAVRRRDLARRASALVAVLAGTDDARSAAAAAEERLGALRASASDDGLDVAGLDVEGPGVEGAGVPDLDADGLAATRAALAAEEVRLVRLEQLEQRLPGRRAELAREEGALAADAAQHTALRADLAGRPAARTRLEGTVTVLAEAAADAGAARADLSAATARREAARHAEALGAELDAARGRAATAVAAARRAVGVEADLRSRRLAGMAGELAAGLVPGRPCPVCGAGEHPAPAALGADHPGADAVASAEDHRVSEESAAAAAVADVDRLTDRLAAQRALAGAPSDELEAEVAALTARLRVAEEAGTRLVDARRELDTHLTDTDVLVDRVHTLEVRVAQRAARIEELLTALEADAKEVDAARCGAPSVAARLSEVRRQRSTLADLAAALAVVTTARADLRRRTAELDRALADADLPDVASARAAVLPPTELRRLEDRVTAHATALARVDAGLAEPALAALPDRVRIDVPAARETCAELERVAVEAARRATLATRCDTAAQRALEEVRATLAAHAAARSAAAPVARMADLASASGADNAQRLTLATYVLARRFEDVVAAANDRLAGMSDGRFELVRSEEREDVRSHKRGLAMKVVDHRLEAERDPRTLSGGETFYVSLCLALGLADVVTAEAGGIDLGTLFVDEGFGTLDPETLDAVLAELGRLRAGGRVVGVVSHVEALKQSIADRIEVRRLADGSSTLSVRAG